MKHPQKPVWLFLGVLLAAAILVSLQTFAQSILGKSPYDKVLVSYFDQNTNANSTLIGLGLYGTVPLKLVYIQLVDQVSAATIPLTISNGVLYVNGSVVTGSGGSGGANGLLYDDGAGGSGTLEYDP